MTVWIVYAHPEWADAKKTAESARTPPFLLEHHYVRTKVIRIATASERPSVGPDRARDNEPARILWPPGQYEA